MSYLLLIMEPAQRREQRAPGRGQVECERMLAFLESLKARGLHLASESLRSLADGTRVEARNGRHSVVDGPFAEAKEIVGGFFLLDVASRNEALEIAAECPAAEWASVEVREVGPCYLD